MNKSINKPSAAAEVSFMRQLRQVGKMSGHLVEAHLKGLTIKGPVVLDGPALRKAAEAYAKSLGPWARVQAAKMLEKISAANRRAMRANARAISQGMRLVAESAVGQEAAKLMDEQVVLIQSIPIRAAERAQTLALEAVYGGERASQVAERLMKSGKVAEGDAILIARTEVARANSVLTQARSQAVGSTHYIWRTSKDSAVRHSHAEMEGKVIAWANPPTLSDGTTGHAGTFPNCRCYPEPVFTEQTNRRKDMLKAAVFIITCFALFSASLPAHAVLPTLNLRNQYGEVSNNWITGGSGTVTGTCVTHTIPSNLTGSTAAPLCNTYSAVSAVLLPTQLLTGWTSGAGTVAGTDTVIAGLQKVDGNANQLQNGQFTPTSETLTGAGTISTTKMETLLSNSTGGDFAATLAAPSSQDGQIKIIKMTVRTSHNFTLALTNVSMSGAYTPTGTTTLTFAAVGDSAIFMAVGGKWVYLGGSAVAT